MKRLPHRRLGDRIRDAVWAARSREGIRGQVDRLDEELQQSESARQHVERLHHVAHIEMTRLLTDDAGVFATWVPPGHFYSPLPSFTEIDRGADRIFGPRDETAIPGVDLKITEQLELVAELGALAEPLGIPRYATEGWRFHGENASYEMGDASVLAGMLLHIRPTRVIEVGSGYSSALMLDLRDRVLPGLDLTFIEPYPDLLDDLVTDADRASTTHLRTPVQDVAMEVFTGLEAGDVLVIDSSHVAKIGSDVNHLFLEVLPRLDVGVWVHVHDVFWPFEYPERWVREGRAWNEQYLLRALLQDNDRWEVRLFTHLLQTRHPERFIDAFPGALPLFGGSFWMRRC